MNRRTVLGGSLAALVAGCRPLRTFPFDHGVTGGNLTVRFFSVACFHLEHDGLGLLTDPFFSHLPLGQVASGVVVAEPSSVDPHRHLLGDVAAVVVGHGHYDHCLALPEIASDLPRSSPILAGRTVAHTFAPNGLPQPFVAVNDIAATATSSGSWVDVVPGRLRVMPIASGHPDNIPGVHLFTKRLSEDRAVKPQRAHDYQEGDTFAFLVDWLNDGEVAWRVYVQTSSRGLPDGLLPASVLGERGVDIALLAMDSARAEAAGRESIQEVLRPRRILFCHWGDFFRSKAKPPWEGVKVDLRRLKARLPSTTEREVLFPGWGSTFSFSHPPGGPHERAAESTPPRVEPPP